MFKRFRKVGTATFENFLEDDTGSDKLVIPRCISVAGLTCTDWCPGGSQRRGAGVSEQYHSVWLGDRLVSADNNSEDIAFSECSDRYPLVEKQAQPLKDTHKVVGIKISPHLIGFPVMRARVFGAAINRAKMVWVGPSTVPEVTEDVLRMFAPQNSSK